MTDRSWYIAAINRVVDYIDAHLAEALDLETLARAGFTDLTIYGGYDKRSWRPEGDTVIIARAP